MVWAMLMNSIHWIITTAFVISEDSATSLALKLSDFVNSFRTGTGGVATSLPHREAVVNSLNVVFVKCHFRHISIPLSFYKDK